MLSPEQIAARKHKITGSMFPTIMSSDTKRINDLWRVEVGMDPPPDLSNEWPVQFGSHIEAFGLDWHQRRIGVPLTERGRVVNHPTLRDICCTLDAYDESRNMVLDHKACSGWQKIDGIVSYYTPQIICQMRCRGAARGALLILHGGGEPQEHEVLPDAAYEEAMWERVKDFQNRVEMMVEPFPQPALVPPDQWRTVDLEKDSPNWAGAMIEALVTWGDSKAKADINDIAAAEIKLLLPQDVRRVVWTDLEIKRNKRGSVTITRGN